MEALITMWTFLITIPFAIMCLLAIIWQFFDKK